MDVYWAKSMVSKNNFPWKILWKKRGEDANHVEDVKICLNLTPNSSRLFIESVSVV